MRRAVLEELGRGSHYLGVIRPNIHDDIEMPVVQGSRDPGRWHRSCGNPLSFSRCGKRSGLVTPRLKRATVWPSASQASTRAGPKKRVPPTTRIRLGAKLAHALDGSKDEQTEAAVSSAECLRNFRRSTFHLAGIDAAMGNRLGERSVFGCW